MNIYSWSDLADEFKDTLILGNGASIAIDSSFRYQSLFKKGQITENIRKIFKHFNTSDFELVLRMLWHASHINHALEIKDSITSDTYKELRTALVETVREIHIDHHCVEDKLLNIASFMRQFPTVVSLNYDLLVYWAMLLGNDKWGERWFKDCFINGEFRADWGQYRKPYRNAGGSTLVFYPHGNLALATDINGKEIKFNKNGNENLLDTIVKKWEGYKYTPLFVSEGTTEQKSHAISRSLYLNTIHDSVLTEKRKSVVIFGWSMSNHDIHIINAIAKSKPDAIAVSVFKNGADWNEHCIEIETKLKRIINNKNLQIKFFDAESEGCWANSSITMENNIQLKISSHHSQYI